MTIDSQAIAQMVVENTAAIEHGVRRITGPARLGPDITADLVSDAMLALLERGASYDPSKASPAAFCRMVAFQVALDKLRAMKRGGQFSGAYAGFGNAQLNAAPKDADGNEVAMEKRQTAAVNPHKAPTGAVSEWKGSEGRAVRVGGSSLLGQLGASNHADDYAERDWLNKARAAVAAVLPSLTGAERALWAELEAGTFDASEYAERAGIATATAHVRANRLRAKVRDLLKAAA